MYHHGARDLQDHFDSRRLADRLQERSRTAMNDEDRAFIARRDMLFLATADEEGRPQCSYKGGDEGFVTSVDDHTLAFPSYDGNGMFLSAETSPSTRTWRCCSSTSPVALHGGCGSWAGRPRPRPTRCSSSTRRRS